MPCRITFLFDNRSSRDDLETGWGFSAFVEHGHTRWLFDTGWDGDQVLRNADRLGVNLLHVDGIILSHSHWDHAGGLPRVMAHTTPKRVAVPATLSGLMRAEIARRTELVTVDGPMTLAPGLHSTGPLPPTESHRPDEQALLIDVDDGIVILTGCAHPGLDAILEAARQRGPIIAVLGGFHGFDNLDALNGVDQIVPAHCTQHTADILQRFPATAKHGAAGDVWSFPC